jgi:hypothetical protein
MSESASPLIKVFVRLEGMQIFRLLLPLVLGLSFSLARTNDRLDIDVLVLGSEPEGIIAAVAAAQEGARTVLVTLDSRVGGLFVTGEMNSLDLRTQPELYQRGLFEVWWRQVGRGSAFDVVRAEAAFEEMLRGAGVEVIRSAGSMEPLMEENRVVGARLPSGTLYATQVIDATSEADIAAAAGASYTMGFESLGLDARMVDTLVFRIDGVDWRALMRGVQQRGRNYAEINNYAAWGHFGGYPANYQAVEPGIRLRGLNLGLQEDGSVLVNALLIYDIDPFDPESRAEGKARATREAPRMIEYLKQDVPGFDNAHFGGVAETLYIRETRHIEALCTLTVDDVLDNVVTELDVAAGGYPLDVQTLTPGDSGFVYGTPEIYGAQLCVTVPRGVDNLWVAGKAAGYDPLAASSARVVPFGMALGEAIGVAAAQAIRQDLTSTALVESEARVRELRSRLQARGAYLPAVRQRQPSGPHAHAHWEDYRVLRSRGLALGGYNNDPRLDEEMPALGFAYLLSNVSRRFHADDDLGRNLLQQHPALTGPLTPELALAITRDAACELGVCLEADWQALQEAALAPAAFPPAAALTRGEAYALAASLAQVEPVRTAQED